VCADALDFLRGLPDESVNCIVTSPPYYGLRDYQQDGQLGLENTPEQYVTRLVAIFAEARRALRSDGTCWLNLGDSYVGGGFERQRTAGTGQKFRLRQDLTQDEIAYVLAELSKARRSSAKTE
jgi:DNA modification methylase